jgi:hypothetical protein
MKSTFVQRIVFFLSVLVLMAAIYLWVDQKGLIPQLPRIEVTVPQEIEVMTNLSSRLEGFRPSDEENLLMEDLISIHRLETENPSDGKLLKKALDKFRKKVGGFLQKDAKRYLLLGDFLAIDFNRSLKEILKKVGQSNLKSLLAKDKGLLDEVNQKGGSFFRLALDRNLIRGDGELNGSKIVPLVLFRIRWRHMGKISMTRGLGKVEQKAYYDFVAAFSRPSNIRKRLSAVKNLKELDSSYDNVIAAALVYHEGGRSEDAYNVLKKARAHDTRNTDLQEFMKALENE